MMLYIAKEEEIIWQVSSVRQGQSSVLPCRVTFVKSNRLHVFALNWGGFLGAQAAQFGRNTHKHTLPHKLGTAT